MPLLTHLSCRRTIHLRTQLFYPAHATLWYVSRIQLLYFFCYHMQHYCIRCREIVLLTCICNIVVQDVQDTVFFANICNFIAQSIEDSLLGKRVSLCNCILRQYILQIFLFASVSSSFISQLNVDELNCILYLETLMFTVYVQQSIIF